MKKNSFFSREEIADLGFASVGEAVCISRFARFYNPGNIHIGDHTRIDDFCIISAGSEVKIGKYIHIAAYTSLFGGGGIRLDDFVNISSRVALYSVTDDVSGESLTNPMIPVEFKQPPIEEPVILEKHSFIATNCTVLPGVCLREGSVVGAHSLVKKDIPAWEIWAGSPAKFLGNRERLLLEKEKLLWRSLGKENVDE